MREKTPIALKEAREEAQRLRESAGSADEEFEEEEQGTMQNKPTSNSTSMNIFMVRYGHLLGSCRSIKVGRVF